MILAPSSQSHFQIASLATLSALFLFTLTMSLFAYAGSDDGCGINGGDGDCPKSLPHHVSPPKLRKQAYAALAARCSDLSKQTWVVQGKDLNGNDRLDAGEFDAEKGHCENWVHGPEVALFNDRYCDGGTTIKSPIGIDEDLNGKVEDQEFRAALYRCKDYSVELNQSRDDKKREDDYERKHPTGRK